MPISRKPGAASAQQAARLFRALADPTRLAILLVLQEGERRIVDVAAELGGSQASVSSHLASLEECGLITCRPQGRAVCYRLTGPKWAPCCKPPGSCSPGSGARSSYAATPATMLLERYPPDPATGTRAALRDALNRYGGSARPGRLELWTWVSVARWPISTTSTAAATRRP